MLVVLFFYNTVGVILINPVLVSFYKYKRLQEIFDNSRKNLIEQIILNKEDILSRKSNYVRINPREFRLNGSLYDIVKETDNDSFICLYCINDEKEDLLEKKLQKLEEATGSKAEGAGDFSNYDPQISEAVSYLAFNRADTDYSQIKNHNEISYYQVRRDIPTPPPKSFSSI